MGIMVAGTVLYFFIAGSLFGYGLGKGDAPTKDSPWQLQALYVALIVFWPLTVLGGWLLGETNGNQD